MGMTKDELDKFSALSQQRGADATKGGKFNDEIIPLKVKLAKGDSPDELHTVDEGLRPTTLEGVAKLKPMLKNGIITPATSSQICDGASAILVCNETGLKKLGLRPKAKIVALSVVGSDPVVMLEGPVPATGAALKRAGLKAEDIDVVEVNEAFAPVPLAVAKAHFGGSLDKINVNGGAMSLGHPLGRYGLLSICEGGGTANATIIERMP